MKSLTIVAEGIQEFKTEVPDESVAPLLAYMRKHEKLLPFEVSARIFLRHWQMGVNLSTQCPKDCLTTALLTPADPLA